ncbi:MAG: ATP-dependent DNA helicase [Lentisphaeria bacterium]|jgi:ATP-dependent DNA helicase DinG
MSVELTEAFFGAESPLRSVGGAKAGFLYEPRPQQAAMAKAVAEALADEANLCVEAPTGVGKTFAYLVPAYYHALATGKPVIVSTHTINLQEQIIGRDIPLLEKILDVEIRAEVAKGRGNYLCLRRLNQLADTDQALLPDESILGELGRLLRWAEKTRSGDRGDFPGSLSSALWSNVCCERGTCTNKQCNFYRSCFLMKVRRSVHQAQIVVANHALFFSALAMGQDGGGTGCAAESEQGMDSILPSYSAVVLDEGHTLEDCAASHLGLRADSFVILRQLSRLYSDERKAGMLMAESAVAARAAVSDCRRRATLFFQRLNEWLADQYQNPLRYTVPGHISNYLAEPLRRLDYELRQLIQREDDQASKQELTAVADELKEQCAALDSFFTMELPEYVYWFERMGRDGQDISFNVVPVDVAPIMRDMLFSNPPVIITSATLAVDGNINYFQHRLGAEEARTLILDTPFDFSRQVTLHICDHMPDPRAATDAFQDEAAKYIQHYLRLTRGRAFVLFTSYSMMHEIAMRLEDFCAEEKLTMLVQGEGLTPRKMLESFKETEGAVILGTASFWTGVDVPGDALSNVIITRLPFAVPDHPLCAARSEKAAREGRNSFFDYSLPDAVLKFRQGFGRLIRSKDDTGIVVVLDSRIVTKRYGRVFLNSIPACPVEMF